MSWISAVSLERRFMRAMALNEMEIVMVSRIEKIPIVRKSSRMVKPGRRRGDIAGTSVHGDEWINGTMEQSNNIDGLIY